MERSNQKILLSDASGAYEFGVGPIPRIFGPESFFQKAQTLEIEIGSGRGHFLKETALSNPKRFFLGIESAHAYAWRTEELLKRYGVSNARVIDWSAELFLPFLKDKIASRFHIYFPDPWPKKRHHKKRLWREEFLEEMARILRDDGKVYFATDHADYFHAIEEVLTSPRNPFRLDARENFRFFEDAQARTLYENRFLGQKKKIFYFSLIKKI